MTAPVLDRKHLARYTGGDAALEAELFGLLIGQIEACVAQLRAAQAEAGWTQAAHTLKGAARGVGAMALGDACAAAEAHPLNDKALAHIEAEAARAKAAMAG
jgi:HPt (histidine-containing phosphotransfer) domain-containing protein